MEAIILAGGQSKRMGGDLPKPLVVTRDYPVIEWQIRYLASQGVNHIVVSVGYKAELVQDFLEVFGSQLPHVVIDTVVEEQPLGTGGGLKKAIHRTTEDKVLVVNVDDITDIDITQLFLADENTLSVTNPVLPYGQVTVKDGYAVFTEKPTLKDVWVSCGWYMFNRAEMTSLLDTAGEKFSLEEDIFPKTKLRIYQHEGFWHPLTTIKDVQTFGEVVLPERLRHIES